MGVYNKQGDILEIYIRDSSNRKLEQFKANLQDKKLCKKIISIVEHKYNLVVDSKDNCEKKEDDIDWMDLNNEFFK